MAYVVVLGSPLTHSCLVVFIRSSESAILVRLHREVASSGTRRSCCKPVVLITLGGHLIDDLVACDSVEACENIVRCSGGGFVRRIVLTPQGSRRATLVERVIELPSLSG